MLVAGTARAQFDECVLPSDVPEAFFETILDQASFAFGDVTEKTCDAIVKEGLKTCKTQVKAADKCYDRALDANYKIVLKQCNELEDPEERAVCKTNVKGFRDNAKSDIELDKESGLGICDDEFQEALLEACLGIVLKL
jgi:hypothetical protein